MEIRHESNAPTESKAHLKSIFVCFPQIKCMSEKSLKAWFRLILLLLQSVDSSGVNGVHCL